ncbi:hypothetical protein HD806DRAFT_369388 [Xylariaceae sp. AK1471]|nr:hypothetical protein HD806DRAFT_369388 [Xylariaceae sp. AK1471]
MAPASERGRYKSSDRVRKELVERQSKDKIEELRGRAADDKLNSGTELDQFVQLLVPTIYKFFSLLVPKPEYGDFFDAKLVIRDLPSELETPKNEESPEKEEWPVIEVWKLGRTADKEGLCEFLCDWFSKELINPAQNKFAVSWKDGDKVMRCLKAQAEEVTPSRFVIKADFDVIKCLRDDGKEALELGRFEKASKEELQRVRERVPK